MRFNELPRACVAALLLVACSAAPLAAQEAIFDEGNRLYREGDFAGAVELHERILERGVESGELHYNLGNAWFRLGELGRPFSTTSGRAGSCRATTTFGRTWSWRGR